MKPDPASGAVLGVPERVLPKRTSQPGGTRWQSADGRITLETKSYPPGETGLEAIFARITAPTPERRVSYKLLRPDFLVVTAETPGASPTSATPPARRACAGSRWATTRR